MMQQWDRCKQEAGDALVFFRLGDFYEAFYEDAKTMATDLGLTLTQRQSIPMCGVPAHAAEQYIDKLLAQGHKIAVAEQMESPAESKGLVARKIVRFFSPGAVVQSRLLSAQSNNFLVSLIEDSEEYAIGVIDVSTAELRLFSTKDLRDFVSEICRLRPVEILLSEEFAKKHRRWLKEISLEFPFLLNEQKSHIFYPSACQTFLENHFRKHAVDCIGPHASRAEIVAVGALIHHLKEHLYMDLSHIQKVEKEDICSFLSIDKTCLANLNILPCKEHKYSLIETMDTTRTPMGARLLRHWVKKPLISQKQIDERLDAVQELIEKQSILSNLVEMLGGIRDLERLLMRIANGQCSPQDFSSLRRSLLLAHEVGSLPPFQSALLAKNCPLLCQSLPVVEMIGAIFVEEPPHKLHEGPCFRPGYDQTLDELQQISGASKDWIANYQNTLRDELGIKTLKVGYTKAFGYYIEVSRGQAAKMPATFVRKQTLTNAERFLSDDLKEFEYKILSAEDRIKALEKMLFTQAKEQMRPHIAPLLSLAKALSLIDVLASFAETAMTHGYVRPEIVPEDRFSVRKGRHAIIERALAFAEFIPNDTEFTPEARVHLITGPNMSGKSTYIRQCALLAIMAQAGSFVPAESLILRPFDQIFSRIGAADNIAAGKSTFMLEMEETAAILHKATSSSLVLLDEIGRGTSTYDGISIAGAVAEFLAQMGAKTLFATHYKELTKLEGEIEGVKNFRVAVQEGEDAYGCGIVFLHEILPGTAPKSYALHVAHLAGMPKACLNRAERILAQLEKRGEQLAAASKEQHTPAQKIACIQELGKINLSSMTPTEVYRALQNLQQILGMS